LKRRHILIAAAGAVAPNLARAAPSGDDLLKAYVGAFRHTGGDKERIARDRAIEDVVSGMSFLVRKIARDRLTAANAIAVALTFSRTARSLTIAMDDRSFTGPLDGSKTKVKSIGGDEMDMSYQISRDSVTQNFERDGRGRTNTFTLDGDKSLRMNVRVFADQLPKDLVYELTYVRT
jgi:hypothetical protein